MFTLSAGLLVLPLFLCAELPSFNNDWLTVQKGQFYLGKEPFFPIGSNIWTREDWEAEFRKKMEMGVNVFRGWMGWLDLPESRETRRREMEFGKIVQMAEKHRVFLLVSLFDGCSYNNVFGQTTLFQEGQTVFNMSQGGPCNQPRDILIHPESIEMMKARIRKIVDLWGNSPAILGWDLMNELDMVPNSQDEQAAWVKEISEYLRWYELQKFGRHHLRTVSSYQPEPRADFFYNSPILDFASTHMYHGSVIDPKDTIRGAVDAGVSVRHIIQRLSDNRPYLDTENGPILHLVDPCALAPPPERVAKAYNNLAWAEIAAGASGPGFLVSRRLVSVGAYEAMPAFAALWLRKSGPVRPLEMVVSGAVGFGSRRGEAAIFWIIKEEKQRFSEESVELSVSGLENDEYEIIFYSDSKPEWLGSTRIHGPSFSLKMIPFRESVAGAICPISVNEKK
ncbi:MAG: hypothetical protein JSW13_01685 [Candidatus Aerophobus sp.]|nr:MAG: hypothetical protein JSW13_01685 [Candidatus Aerophobus sp.]